MDADSPTEEWPVSQETHPCRKPTYSCKAANNNPITPHIGIWIHRYFLYPFWNFVCLNLGPILCMQSQPLWIRMYNCPVMFNKFYYTEYVQYLQHLKSFHNFFCNDIWVLGRGIGGVCDVDVPLKIAFHCFFFSAPLWVLGLYINQHIILQV